MNKIVDEKLSKLRNDATINNVPILRPLTAKSLANEVTKKNPLNILEIGTAIGYSGILMLNCSQSSKLVTIEKDEQSANIAMQNFTDVSMQNRVKILCGDAIDFLPKINEKFDFVFLDGPKGQYIKYLPYLLNILEKDGIMFSDNVLYRGMVNGKTPVKKNKKTLVKNLQAFLQNLENNKNVKNTVFDVEDGYSITKKLN